MQRLTIRIVAATLTFVVGIACASFYVARHYCFVEEAAVQQTAVQQTAITPFMPALRKSSHPEGWQRVNVADKFSFYIPPDMKRLKSDMGVEYIGVTEFYGNKALSVSYSYLEKHYNDTRYRGLMSCEEPQSALKDRSTYRRSDVVIGGKTASQVFWRYEKPVWSGTTLCFPNLGDGSILWFRAFLIDEQALNIAQQVFDSVEFP